jgi:hypothetical protein
VSSNGTNDHTQTRLAGFRHGEVVPVGRKECHIGIQHCIVAASYQPRNTQQGNQMGMPGSQLSKHLPMHVEIDLFRNAHMQARILVRT